MLFIRGIDHPPSTITPRPGVEPDVSTGSVMDGDITSPVQAAADLGHTEVIQLLVSAGAKKLGIEVARGDLRRIIPPAW